MNTMKCSFLEIFLILAILLCFGVCNNSLSSSPTDNIDKFSSDFNIKTYGAIGDGKTINTQAINNAVNACASAGGGRVIIPAGTFITGTVHMKSNVSLFLEKGAIIKGISDLDAYHSYVPIADMTKYDNAYNTRWNRALILGVGVTNVAIMGSGTIDGDHVYDSQGEEGMRGPNTILFAESQNLSFSGFTVEKAANYAFMAYEVKNVVYSDLLIMQGWDGIHIRGGKDIIIRNSSLYTGDDAIAGGYWENMEITNCRINSSCNGIRAFMPVENLTVSHCNFFGPGRFPHRTSKRNNMLAAILVQPGSWFISPGGVDKIHIHDVIISDLNNPLMMVLNEGNTGGKILVERMNAVKINAYASSVESWKDGVFNEVIFRDISIEYIGHPNASSSGVSLRQPRTEARNLPCWGLFARNVRSITFENVNIHYTDTDPRPALYFDNVSEIRFNGMQYTGNENREKVVFKNCGVWYVDGLEIKIH